MTQNVYYLISDGGDGSAGTVFFKEKPDLDRLMEINPEYWGLNDVSVGVLTFPDGLDLDSCGFYFCSVNDLYEEEGDEEIW